MRLITTMMLATLLTIFTIVSAGPIQKTDDVRFTFRNNCGFDVYVREAVAQHPSPRPDETCQNYGESPDVLIKGGSEYYTTFPVLKDSCGHSVKVTRSQGGAVYQYEFNWALENGRVWYNLSHEDGNPFTDMSRKITMASCPTLVCSADNDGGACDYPIQTDCGAPQGLFGYICGD